MLYHFLPPLSKVLQGDEKSLLTYLQSKAGSGIASNVKDFSGVPAIVFAASRGHAHIVKLLISNRANVNEPEDHTKRTALMRACQGGFVKVSRRVNHFVE